MGKRDRFKDIFIILLAILFGRVDSLLAQQVMFQNTAKGEFVVLKAIDGREIRLASQADDDEDGIENSLEINGFTYSPTDGLQPWDGDESKTYFKTDPLRWSSDGDPYSDFMEVSGVNMPSGVPSPENKPLVAARPVINIGMTDYDVILISEITNTSGGEESSSYTNETSNTDEVGGEVTVGASLNPFKLISAEVSAHYSHTWTRTQSTTSTLGTNWSNTRSTNPSQAARLKLRIFMRNLGSATALDVRPTFNLVLGEKTIATITPNQVADRLAPKGLPRSRYPETGTIVVEKDDANNDIILSLDELKAIQRGAPLGLVVTQVDADVARWNPATQSFDSREGWSSFEGEIDPVVVNIKANLGDDEIYNYQVYVGTDFYDLGFTFKDVVAQVFELEENGGGTTIAGRRYPDDWYVSTPSEVVIEEWNNRGQPQSLFGIDMFRNTKMVLMSPGNAPQAKIDLATFSPDFTRIYVSAFPGNFPILAVRAQVTINGQQREVELLADGNSFYTNTPEFEDAADVNGQVFVENARGDVTVANIILPALYKNAAEVKAFETLLPSPGGEYLMFSGGDPDKPVKLYCLFDDPKTSAPLSEPREYLTLPASSDSANYIDWIFDPFHRRMYFSKVRINPDNFRVIPFDTTFTIRRWIGDQRFITQDPPLAFGSIHLEFAHLDSAAAKVDLTGTPFSLDPYTEFVHAQRGADDIIYVDESRQVMTVRATEPPGHTSDSEGSIGIKPDSISLVYNRDFYSGASSIDLPGKAAQFNMSSEGSKGYINMGASNTLEVSTSLTIEAWIKPEPHGRPNSSTGFAVFLNREGEYELFYRPEDGSIWWALATSSPGWASINTHYPALIDEWLHVALTYDSGAEQSAIKTYINGNLYHATVASGPISDFPSHQNQDSFRIAAREGTEQHYSGVVDEVRIWSVARTQEEIRAALVDTLGPEIYEDAKSGLIGYWRFDELEDLGIGGDGADDVRDYSVNGNHGDLVGDAQLSDIATSVKFQDAALPRDFTLQQNYPNPFNPQTQISFMLPEKTRIKLQIFNLIGQKVATILDGVQPAGRYTATWSGRDEMGRNVASGIYVYRLQAGELVLTRKMTLLR